MGKKYCNTTLCLYHFDMAYALAYKAGYMKTLPGHETEWRKLNAMFEYHLRMAKVYQDLMTMA